MLSWNTLVWVTIAFSWLSCCVTIKPASVCHPWASYFYLFLRICCHFLNLCPVFCYQATQERNCSLIKQFSFWSYLSYLTWRRFHTLFDADTMTLEILRRFIKGTQSVTLVSIDALKRPQLPSFIQIGILV